MGRKTITESQLNMSWIVAPANARRKSSADVICPMETMVFVTDVPMFAPIIIGIAWLTLKTRRIFKKKKKKKINKQAEPVSRLILVFIS